MASVDGLACLCLIARNAPWPPTLCNSRTHAADFLNLHMILKHHEMLALRVRVPPPWCENAPCPRLIAGMVQTCTDLKHHLDNWMMLRPLPLENITLPRHTKMMGGCTPSLRKHNWTAPNSLSPPGCPASTACDSWRMCMYDFLCALSWLNGAWPTLKRKSGVYSP